MWFVAGLLAVCSAAQAAVLLAPTAGTIAADDETLFRLADAALYRSKASGKAASSCTSRRDILAACGLC